MILWLIKRFQGISDSVTATTTGDSVVYLTARIAAASLLAFLAAVVLGPFVIRWLKKRFRERIASASETLNRLHADKQDTPTMGGVFIMSAVLISTLLFADLTSPRVLIAMGVISSFTLLGAWDDWVKQRTDRNGITARQKMLVQCLLASTAGVLLYFLEPDPEVSQVLFWPVGGGTLILGWLVIPLAVVVIVATCNSVNLTDGLDGLAAGCTVSCGAAFVALCYLSGHRVLADYLSIPYLSGSGELAVILGGLVGAMLGFLWFNAHPAQVFMGDAGALPAGALIGLCAVVIRQEILLILIGGVFVTETASVLLQVSWYRWKGTRILRCSPLHNHFVFRGDPETRIVIRFWIVAALLAIAGLASLKVR